MRKSSRTPRRSIRYETSFETSQLRQRLQDFFQTEYKEVSGEVRSIGSYKWGVYIFYDYDGEPIYVGQTKEQVQVRIGRHLTNQRTDAVAMSVLDPFEVYEIEVYPLPEYQDVKKGHGDFAAAKRHLNALEAEVHRKAVNESSFKAILNEVAPPNVGLSIALPESVRGRIVSKEVEQLRRHADVRTARRAQVISRLAQIISERQVQNGLRKTLVTQASRLHHLAKAQYEALGGERTVQKRFEGDQATVGGANDGETGNIDE